VSVAIETGTRTTSLFGLISYGCLIVSKMPSGGDGFSLGGVWMDIFVGYLYEWWFR